MPAKVATLPKLERLENRRPLAASSLDLLHSNLVHVEKSESHAAATVLIPQATTPHKPQAAISKVPLYISIHLAPGEQVPHPSASNSGGITYDKQVTIEGHTIPGSIVFVGSNAGDETFSGKALATDSQGDFSDSLDLKAILTTTEFLVVDPSGERKLRVFPILLEKA